MTGEFRLKTLLSAPLLFAAACAASTPDIIQVGPWFPARRADEVGVFYSKEETLRPWGAIAIIHSDRFPAGDKTVLDRQKKQARKMAAGIGADGLIITEQTDTGGGESGGYQGPETFISALAFKYVAAVSTATKEGPPVFPAAP